MEVITINQLRVALGQLSLSHKFVNDFFWGDINSMRAWKERIAQYPLVTAYTTGITGAKNIKEVTLNLEVSDKMYADWNKNLNEIESDTADILMDLFDAIRNKPEWRKIAVVQNENFTAAKFINETGDVVAGWRASITLKLLKASGDCLAPFDAIAPTPPITCADGTVRNSDGSYDDTVASGGELELPDITVTDSDGSTRTQPSVTDVVCTPQIPLVDGVVDIRDTDNTLIGSQNVANNSTEDFIVPDSLITLKDTDGLTLQTESLKATQPLDLVAPDATVNITNSDNDLLGNVVVPSGGSDTFEVPDEDITVNGNLLVTKPSAQDYDVEVVDSLDNPIGVVSGGKVVVSELPIKTDFIVAAYNENDLFTTAFVTVTGTVNDVIIEGLTSVTMKRNGTVITSLTSVTAGDVITFEFDSAVSEGVILIEGYYA